MNEAGLQWEIENDGTKHYAQAIALPGHRQTSNTACSALIVSSVNITVSSLL